jgi:hypothetical protein
MGSWCDGIAGALMRPTRQRVALLDDVQQAAWRQRADALGWRCVTLDCAGLNDVSGVLKALGRVLALPEYYGANCDALYDCLTDQVPDASHTIVPGLLLLLINLPRVSRAQARSWAVLRTALRDAAAAWAEQGACLQVGYTLRAPEAV